MNKQPEALRLAGELDPLGGVESEAAAELRRLHEVNQELLEALKTYGAHSNNCDCLILLTSMPPQRKPCSCGLYAAITKAGEQP